MHSAVPFSKCGAAGVLILEVSCTTEHKWPWCKYNSSPTRSIWSYFIVGVL